MVKTIARRFVWVLPPLGMDLEDLHAEGRIAVLRAIRTYDRRNRKCMGTKESSYVGTCVRRAYLDLGKSAARKSRGGDGGMRAEAISVVEFEEWMLVAFSLSDEMEARSDVRKLRRRLPEVMMALLALRFGYGYEVRELVSLTGFTERIVEVKIEQARQRAIALLAA